MQAAYPAALAADVLSVLRIVPVGTYELTADDLAPVTVAGETLSIPYRVYFPEPASRISSRLTPRQRLILATLFTRHSDGFIRERRLRQAITSTEAWVAPFVVRLLGEYVIEIADAIEEFGVPDRKIYAAFVEQNPEYCERLSARIVSYWNVYYRGGVPDFSDYAFYRAARAIGAWTGRIPRRRR